MITEGFSPQVQRQNISISTQYNMGKFNSKSHLLIILIIFASCAFRCAEGGVCNASVDHCVDCSAMVNTTCLTCVSGYRFIPVNANYCSCGLTGCLSCDTNPSVCDFCDGGYYINPSQLCTLCLSAIASCYTCSTSTFCTNCISQYYLVNATFCQRCNNTINNCDICANATNCSSCETGYIVNANFSGCQFCNTSNVHCNTCTSSNTCTLCQTQYALVTGTLGAVSCSKCDTNDINCMLCPSITNCSQCYTTAYFINITYKCQPCTALSYCLNCISSSICINCTSYAFLSPTAGACLPCNTTLQYCVRCNSSIICLECTGPYHYLNTTINICKPCNYSLIQCITCIGSSTCTLCVTPFYYLNLNVCSLCNIMTLNCQQCDALTGCKVCQNDFYLNTSKQCQCISGVIVTGVCSNVTHCASAVKNASIHYCNGCESGYHLVGGSNCTCDVGWDVTKICTEIYGCIAMKNDLLGKRCVACNINSKFVLKNGTCVCMTNYFFNSTSQCEEICGDGFVLDVECDDGNVQNGDGCSSVCLIQKNYQCFNGSATTPSECVYKFNPFKLKLTSINKIFTENTGIFKFQLNPVVYSLDKMNFSNYITFTANSDFNVSLVEYSNGFITVTVSFYKNLEGLDAKINLKFDPTLIKTKEVPFSFTMVSDDYKLVIVSDADVTFSSKFQQIILILTILALVIFVVGSMAHKMIGVETIHVFQFVFFIQLAKSDLTVLLNGLNALNYSHGYGKQFYYNASTSISLGSFFSKSHSNKQFLQNQVMVLAIQILFTLVFLILAFIIYKYRPTKQENIGREMFKMKEIQHENYIMSKKYIFFHKFYLIALFPLLIGFISINLLNIGLNNTRIFSTDFNSISSETTTTCNIFNSILNSFSLLAICLASSSIFWYEISMCYCSKNRSKSKNMFFGVARSKQLYIPIYLLYTLTLIFLFIIEFLYQSSLINYCIAALIGAYMIFILCYRPYQDKIHNFAIIINQIALVICTACILYREEIMKINAGSFQTSQEKIILICIVVGLCLVDLIALLRLVLEIQNISQRNKEIQTANKLSKDSKDTKETKYTKPQKKHKNSISSNQTYVQNIQESNKSKKAKFLFQQLNHKNDKRFQNQENNLPFNITKMQEINYKRQEEIKMENEQKVHQLKSNSLQFQMLRKKLKESLLKYKNTQNNT